MEKQGLGWVQPQGSSPCVGGRAEGPHLPLWVNSLCPLRLYSLPLWKGLHVGEVEKGGQRGWISELQRTFQVKTCVFPGWLMTVASLCLLFCNMGFSNTVLADKCMSLGLPKRSSEDEKGGGSELPVSAVPLLLEHQRSSHH